MTFWPKIPVLVPENMARNQVRVEVRCNTPTFHPDERSQHI